jgi:uncharacterized membrane protein YoaK (UPF0700 family)
MDNLRLGFALIGLAGCVDAIGFLRLGGLFVSFMSGNSTRMMVEVLQHGPRALLALGIIILFVAGAFIGEVLARLSPRYGRRMVLAVVTVLLAVAPFCKGASIVTVLPAVLAMGIQNAAVAKMGPVSASLTYVTGTLVHLGQELAQLGTGKKSAWKIHALMWLSMVAGAAAGTLLYGRLGALGFEGAALLACACTIFANAGQRSSQGT